MAARAIENRCLTNATLSFTSLMLLVTAACAMEPTAPSLRAVGTCADSGALNQAVWSDNGITRRHAQKALGACGPQHWDLRVLMAPLNDLDEYERQEAWINLYTALDPLAVADPERITTYLLSKAQSSDPEERRLAMEGFGAMLSSRFSSASLSLSQPALLRGLNDPDDRVRRAAVVAVGVAGWIAAGESTSARTQHTALLKPLGSALITRSSDSSPEVREASIQSMATHANMSEHNGDLQPPVSTSQLLNQLQQRLNDPEALVRLQAVKTLANVSDQNLSPQQKQLRQQQLLLAVQDKELEVSIAGTEYDALPPEKLVDLIRSGSLSQSTIAAVLTSEMMGVPAGERLVREFVVSPKLSLRVQAQRVLNSSYARTGAPIPKDQVASSITTFEQGLGSLDPVIQVDSISGLSELESGLESLALLRPSLASPLLPVRWAAAVAISNANPKDEATFKVLREILATSSDDNLRATAASNLRRSESANAARILGQTAQSESRTLYYVRSCSSYGLGLPQGQEFVAVDAMTQPPCRRAVAESFSFLEKRYEPDVVNALQRSSETGDHDQRFNAIYALGSIVDRANVTAKPKISERIAALLTPIVRNQQEHPEVRRIAATMLHLHRQPMPEFFSQAGLPSPSTACANALEGRLRGPGFRFDPYEGRCMYDTRTGCGDGLPQVFSTLRRMLAPKQAP
jgi:HEAT repeat protein